MGKTHAKSIPGQVARLLAFVLDSSLFKGWKKCSDTTRFCAACSSFDRSRNGPQFRAFSTKTSTSTEYRLQRSFLSPK